MSGREIAVSARSVTKGYRRGAGGGATLREETSQWFSSQQQDASGFFALRDVTFDLEVGCICAILGANGSGKSTLMKLISAITQPTSGELIVRGRVASLLEVGAGFDPELTGRENVYLNAAILGVPEREVAERLSEIVAYAGVEAVLDTPMKRYSSGAFVRLAIAVVFHLDIDVLLIDEVLAVTDRPFRLKCIESTKEFARRGGTVLIAGHQMDFMRGLCDQGLLLENGSLKVHGTFKAVVQKAHGL